MSKKSYKRILRFSTSILLLTLIYTPIYANAASMVVLPSTVSRTVGSTFSVAVNLSSPDKAANAASGVVTFPTDKLEVVSISKANSVINLWVQEPSFSNTQGTVNFEGVALNPGFTGSQGTIITITFRTKTAGQADIKISSGSVLANDGAGTNILIGMSGASVLIKEIPPSQDVVQEKPKTKAKVDVSEAPKKDEITEVDNIIVVSPEVPIITYYQEEVEAGEVVKIQGIANPGVDIKISISKAGESIQQKIVRSTGSGNFVIVIGPVSQPGVYNFTAQAIDEAGNFSGETPPFTIIVNQKWFDHLVESILNYLSLTVILGLSLVGLVIISIFLWYRLGSVVRKMKVRSRETEKTLEKSFSDFRKEINEHILKLKSAKDKRKLTVEEVDFLEKFEDELAEAKGVITKEVEDISRS